MYSQRLLPSLFRRVGVSILLGFAIFVLGVLLEKIVDRYGITGLSALLDDVLIGVLAGLVVFTYEQWRYRAMLEKLRVIAAMNHHVRNALQAIMYVPYTSEQMEQARVIQDSVKRIDWALREVLPANSVDAAPPDHQSVASSARRD